MPDLTPSEGGFLLTLSEDEVCVLRDALMEWLG
jgi:hypothetical protein